jgi:hypothetical protein
MVLMQKTGHPEGCSWLGSQNAVNAKFAEKPFHALR